MGNGAVRGGGVADVGREEVVLLLGGELHEGRRPARGAAATFRYRKKIFFPALRRRAPLGTRVRSGRRLASGGRGTRVRSRSA